MHNEDTVRKLIHTSKKGLPVLYLVSAIMGMSSPITSAGYQAMGAAGQLAALVLAQLVREGTPFVVRGGVLLQLESDNVRELLRTLFNPLEICS